MDPAPIEFLAEELGLPSAPMPAGTTAIAECLVAARLAALAAPAAPPSAAYDPNAPESAYTIEVPDAYRGGAVKAVVPDARAEVLGVSGCDAPYAEAARAHVLASPVKESAQREFEGRTFDLRVVFAPSSFVRASITPPPPALAAAVPVPLPPAKLVDKEPFRPRDAKGGKCDVVVYMDAAGAVYAADLADCREDLRLFVKGAVLGWKFAPVPIDGVAAPAKFTVPVVVK